jgi:hypothetical protein
MIQIGPRLFSLCPGHNLAKKYPLPYSRKFPKKSPSPINVPIALILQEIRAMCAFQNHTVFITFNQAPLEGAGRILGIRPLPTFQVGGT